MRPNFLQTANPFNLATPPAWFLSALRAYDADFVLFPSVKEPLYRTGRYGRYGHGLLRALANNPDTAIFVEHRIWPWKSFLPAGLGGQWQKILFDLPQYDTQRFGNDPGAALDEAEAAIEASDRRKLENELDAMGGDTYRTMKLATGQRVGYGRSVSSSLGKLGQGRRPPAHRPSGAGAGAIFIGR